MGSSAENGEWKQDEGFGVTNQCLSFFCRSSRWSHSNRTPYRGYVYELLYEENDLESRTDSRVGQHANARENHFRLTLRKMSGLLVYYDSSLERRNSHQKLHLHVRTWLTFLNRAWKDPPHNKMKVSGETRLSTFFECEYHCWTYTSSFASMICCCFLSPASSWWINCNWPAASFSLNRRLNLLLLKKTNIPI